MEIIKRTILFDTGKTTDNLVISATTGGSSGAFGISFNSFILVNTGVTFTIPIHLKHTVEEIGIYSDYVPLVTQDANTLLIGEDLTQDQINYIMSNSQNAVNYVVPLASALAGGSSIPLSAATNTYTREWWDLYGKNEVSNDAIRKEVLISLGFKINSSKIQTILSSDTFDNVLGHTYSSIPADWGNNKDGYISYFTNPKNLVTGVTINRLNEVKTFDNNAPFVVGINGVTQVNQMFTAYTINGINYISFSGDGIPTNFSLISSGFNQSNISLDFIIKEDFLTGIVFPSKIENNVDIIRQQTSVLEPFFRLQQLTNVENIKNYANGYFTVDDQSPSIKHTI